MKSYYLDRLEDEASARTILSDKLPYFSKPWLLTNDSDDLIAYLTVERNPDGKVSIQADFSERQGEEDKAVLQLLKTLRQHLGGVVTDDHHNMVEPATRFRFNS